MTEGLTHRWADFPAAYLYMLPTLAAAWLIGMVLPGRLAELGLAMGLASFVVAGAARGLGVHGHRSLVGVAVERWVPFVMSAFLAVAALAVLTSVGGALGALLGRRVGVGELAAGIAGAVAFTGPVVWRYWPVMALPVVAPAAAGLYPGQTGSRWRRPGPVAAGRLTREAGEARYTGPIVGVFYVWMGVLVLVGEPGTPDRWVRAAGVFSYFIAAPLLVWMAVAETARLLAVSGAALPGAPVSNEPEESEAVEDGEEMEEEQSRRPYPGDAAGRPPGEEAGTERKALRTGPSDAFPYRTFPYVEAPRSPFEVGGEGHWFLYFSNRNVCTYLFDPRPVNEAFWPPIEETFEYGYSTLFVVEKLWSAAPTEAVDLDPFSVPVPERLAYDRVAGLGSMVVFRDPGATNVGGSARVSEHTDFHEAVAAARELAMRRNVTVLVGREVERRGWH